MDDDHLLITIAYGELEISASCAAVDFKTVLGSVGNEVLRLNDALTMQGSEA